jgi:hypothetical protein
MHCSYHIVVNRSGLHALVGVGRSVRSRWPGDRRMLRGLSSDKRCRKRSLDSCSTSRRARPNAVQGSPGLWRTGSPLMRKLSAWLVACTLICIVEPTTGAVNRPEESTTPAVADYSTAMFAVLLTTALNCWVFPETMVVFEGDAEMLTLLAPRWCRQLKDHLHRPRGRSGLKTSDRLRM